MTNNPDSSPEKLHTAKITVVFDGRDILVKTDKKSNPISLGSLLYLLKEKITIIAALNSFKKDNGIEATEIALGTYEQCVQMESLIDLEDQGWKRPLIRKAPQLENINPQIDINDEEFEDPNSGD